MAKGILNVGGGVVSVDASGNFTVDTGLIADGASVFNETGVDVDFRIESDDNANMFFVDGGNDRVGIGIATPAELLSVVSSAAATRGMFELKNTGANAAWIVSDANLSGAGSGMGGIRQYWNGTEVTRMAAHTGPDTTNKDDGELAFYTRASGAALGQRMVIDPSGKVGIGIATPASALDVRGTVQVGVDDTGYDVKFFGATAGSFLLWNQATDCLHLTDSTQIKLGDSQDLVVQHDGSHSYITNGTGNLIINTTSGLMKLATETSGIAVTIGHTTSEVTVADNFTVVGTATIAGANRLDIGSSAAADIYMGPSDTNQVVRFSKNAGGDLDILTNSATLHIDEDGSMYHTGGNVGIGTTAPDDLFHVYKGSSGAAPHSAAVVVIEHSNTNVLQMLTPADAAAAIYFGDPAHTNDGGIIYDQSTRYMSFRAGDAERYRINSDGSQQWMGTASGKLFAQVVGASNTGAAHTHDFTLSSNCRHVEVLATESHAAGNWDSYSYAIVAFEPSNTSSTTHVVNSYGVNSQCGNAPTFSKTAATNFRVSFDGGAQSYSTVYYIRVRQMID